jgi:hypothetical protein
LTGGAGRTNASGNAWIMTRIEETMQATLDYWIGSHLISYNYSQKNSYNFLFSISSVFHLSTDFILFLYKARRTQSRSIIYTEKSGWYKQASKAPPPPRAVKEEKYRVRM